MLRIFALAIFLSAALLFVVQPMSGKVLLPLLGGSPAVWNTCMVFFQAVLLLGYLYAHLVTKHLPRKVQVLVHIVVLAVAGATLPMPVAIGEPDAATPILWVLSTLALTVGLPFFVISTSGPLLQRWFSTTPHPDAADPYFLYAASNAGSVVGLFAYPLLLEPLLSRLELSRAWTVGYASLGLLIAGCAWAMMRSGTPAITPASQAKAPPAPPTFGRRLLWLALALAPSSLMLGVTQHITTDVAAIPLIWIVPLGLYLVSFIIAFSQRVRISSRTWARVLVALVIAVMVTMLIPARSPITVIAGLHVLCFFVAALMCHKRLAEDRPDASRLTEFYLIMSLGGVLGGLANAVIAPLVFTAVLEYPIMLGMVCLLRPQIRDERQGRHPLVHWTIALAAGAVLLALLLSIDHWIARNNYTAENPPKVLSFLPAALLGYVVPALRAGLPALLCLPLLLKRGSLRFACGTTALLFGSAFIVRGGDLMHEERTFFGVHRVASVSGGAWHSLAHGTTMHGLQARGSDTFPEDKPPYLESAARINMLFASEADINRIPRIEFRQLIPATYYHPSGPIGDVFKMLIDAKRLDKVALIGLGSGSLAAYAVPGSRFTFYEIDPAVISIASNPKFFSFISDAARDPNVTIGYEFGDGRLKLQSTPEGPFNLIVVDAFSSDAIPVHLVTEQAVEVYLKKLQPHGLIAFHISNRHFDLAPPLSRIAAELNLFAYRRNDVAKRTYFDDFEGRKESTWVVFARDAADFAPLSGLPSWERLLPEKSFPLWTDDYSNLLSVMERW